MVTDKQVEAAWAVIRSCGKPVGAGDGNTYVPRPPNREDIKRALEAAEAAAWEAIESAPKDGTEILATATDSYLPGRVYIAVTQWAEDRYPHPNSTAGWFWPYAIRPTRWRPLHQPPKETT